MTLIFIERTGVPDELTRVKLMIVMRQTVLTCVEIPIPHELVLKS